MNYPITSHMKKVIPNTSGVSRLQYAGAILKRKILNMNKYLLALLCVILSFTTAFAGKETTVSSINGEQISTTLSSLVVRDQFYNDLVSNGGSMVGFKVASSSISAVLRYERSEYPQYDDFVLTVNFDIDLRDSTGAVTSLTNQSLEVKYDKDGSTASSYIDFDVMRYENYLYGKITEINSVTFQDLSSNTISTDIPDDVYLDLQCEAERYYVLDPQTQMLDWHSTADVTSYNQLQISWQYLLGAESYDLEWVFVDVPSGTTSSDNTAYDWSNATRINTTSNFYKISLGYPRGAIIWRVRPVGVDVPNRNFTRRIEGEWSYTPSTLEVDDAFTAGQAYAFSGLDTTMNWTYSVGYAEDGKRKEVIQYFDGSGRSRESVTILNTDTNAIVGQTLYDHQGRPAVQMLPTPVESSGIGFYKNGAFDFNKNYDKEDFATDQRLVPGYTAGAGYTGVLGMDSTVTKTSEYYSEQNGLSGQGNDFIPDAENYPFTQTTYRNDGTNRPTSVGSAGKTFRIGGERTTDFLYARPTQIELDRLFGNEVGLAKHYKKNYVVDANGQATVQYLDQEGRVIATAMAGNTPDNLADLKYRADSLQASNVDLLENNNDLIGGEVVSSYVVTVLGGSRTITFDYSLDGALSCDSCRTTPQCDSCEYDVVITLKNDCGQYMLDTGGDTINPNNYTFENIRLASGGDFTFSAVLPQGTYTLSKRLIVNQSYRDSLANQFRDFLLDLSNVNLHCLNWDKEDLDCELDCDSLCYRSYRGTDENGDRIWYDDDDNTFQQQDPPTAVQTLIDSCIASCDAYDSTVYIQDECELKYDMMKDHMSPHGQYFDDLPNKYQRNADGTLALDANNDLIISATYDTTAWLVNKIGSTPPSFTGESTWDDVRANWQESWADSMVIKYHPEYCIHKYFCVDSMYFYETDISTTPRDKLSSEDRRLYDRRSYENTNTGWASNNRYGYNFLNPFAEKDTAADCSSNDRPAYINEDHTQAEDPLYNKGKNTWVMGRMSGGVPVGSDLDSLRIWMRDYYEHAAGVHFSIWYMLDDPCNIAGAHSGNRVYSGTALAQGAQDIFDGLHGKNQHDPGFIGSAQDQVTKYQFFRESYQFYKKFFMYNHYDRYSWLYKDEDICDCDTTYTYWDDDADYNGVLDTTYFQLLYPRNKLFDSFVPGDTASVLNVSRSYGDTLCFETCESAADSWIQEIKDSCLTQYNALTSAQKDSLREKLIDICMLGCDSSDIGSSLGNQVDSILTHGPRSITYADNFTEVIQDYIDPASCAVTVEYPETIFDQAECNCQSLKDTADAYVSNMDHDVPRWSALDSIATKFNNDLSLSLDSDDVKRWYNFCNKGIDDMLDFPQETECVDCKCQNLRDFITSTYSWMDPSNLSAAQEDSIGDALGAITQTTIDGDSVASWLTECDAADPNEKRFSDFPELLRCKEELEGFVDPYQTAIDDCGGEQDTLAYMNAYTNYIELVMDKLDEWKEDYDASCYDSLPQRESLTMDYTLHEYYYTLYYYDQAGNLVKTVPPKGVDTLAGGNLTKVQGYRTDSTTQTTFMRPDHSFVSNYKYDTYNQLLDQSTPDGNDSKFWYDNIGRMVVSQNARQSAWSTGGTYYYSYTLYDALGRTIEAGEASTSTQFEDETALDSTSLANWQGGLTKRQVTRTYYDTVLSTTVNNYFAGGQENIRARVTSVTYEETSDAYDTTYNYASHYSYDIHGNVNELIQDNQHLAVTAPGQVVKHVNYEYDLVSGNVNKVIYQKDRADQFMHRYCYDADNRITQAETSVDGVIWERDAKYFYYMHGPLHRMEIGDQQVQGCDYAYTAQGWLKVQNANTLRANRDMGTDGLLKCSNKERMFGKDAAGYSLQYFEKDYRPIDANRTLPANSDDYYLASLYKSGGGKTDYLNNTNMLYNGNISMMVTAMLDDEENEMIVHGNSYLYDQANRLVQSNVYTRSDSVTQYTDTVNAENSFEHAVDNGAYRTYYSYDLNGNIDSLSRYGQYNYNNSTVVHLDSLSYRYAMKGESYSEDRNYLMHIDDQQGLWSASVDLDDQGTFTSGSLTANNYEYDDIGQLIKDAKEDIDTIIWNVYGKVSEIRYDVDSKDNLEFLYDAGQNRIAKVVKPKAAGAVKDEEFWTKYYYVRDASGNILTVYKETYAEDETTSGLYHGTLEVLENTIYGGERLGVDNNGVTVKTLFNANYVSGRFVAANGRVLTSNTVNQSHQFYASNDMKFDVNDGSGTFDLRPLALCSLNTDGALTVNDGPYELVNDGGTDYYVVQGGDVVNITVNDTVYVTTGEPIGIDANETITFGGQDVPVELTARNSIERHKPLDRIVGDKQYELSNHLGNVLSTVSDRKNATDGTNLDTDEFGSGTENWTGATATVTQSAGKLNVSLTGANGGAVKGYDVVDEKLYRIGFELSSVVDAGNNIIVQVFQQNPYSATPLLTDTIVDEHYHQFTFCATSDSVTWKIFYDGGSSGKSFKVDTATFDEDGHYIANVLNATDYYPFGMAQPAREHIGSQTFRYGFNGMEFDPEAKPGDKSHYDLGLRHYDPRVGRMFKVDPRSGEYPWQSPFAYHRNNPINNVDYMGGGDPPGGCSNGDCVGVKRPDHKGTIPEQGLVFVPKEFQDSWSSLDGTTLFSFFDGDKAYVWDAQRSWYYNFDGEAYYEGSYKEGHGATFGPTNKGIAKAKEAFENHVIDIIDHGPMAVVDQLKEQWETNWKHPDFWTGYPNLTPYQRGRFDGGSLTGIIEALPTMALTAGMGKGFQGFRTVSGARFRSNLWTLTDADGFLGGSIGFKAPFNIKVGLFASENTLKYGTFKWSTWVPNIFTKGNWFGRRMLQITPQMQPTLGNFGWQVIPKGSRIRIGLVGPQIDSPFGTWIQFYAPDRVPFISK